jgi:hypothetical protein
VKRVLKIAACLIGVTTALRVVGEMAARRFEAGAKGEDSDRVRLAAFWGGRDFRSRAAALRSLHARVILGGINVDLTQAQLHPDGASVEVDARLGGVNIEVPDGWRIEVAEQLRAGGVAIDVPEDVADGAPLLEIRVAGMAAGVNVEAKR